MKKILFVLLFLGIAISAVDTTTDNCDNSTGVFVCQIPISIDGAKGLLKDNMGCFSTDGEYPDLGCIAAIELIEKKAVNDCKYVFDDTIEYLPCEKIVIEAGEMFVAAIDPSIIDYSLCSKYQEDSLYVTECAVMGREIMFGGFVDLSDEDKILLITDMKFEGIDFSRLLFENALYIILVIIIILIGYWVFAPHKPMLQEKKMVAKNVQTKREKRYGRKL
jgi:hypothetical protein